jgi:hypothetical protein
MTNLSWGDPSGLTNSWDLGPLAGHRISRLVSTIRRHDPISIDSRTPGSARPPAATDLGLVLGAGRGAAGSGRLFAGPSGILTGAPHDEVQRRPLAAVALASASMPVWAASASMIKRTRSPDNRPDGSWQPLRHSTATISATWAVGLTTMNTHQ